MSAELAARRAAAAAVAADFHTTMMAWLRGGQQPDYAAWAQRLEQHLRYVLDALDGQDRADARQLAEVREMFARFDSGRDDLQYFIERVEQVVNRGQG